MYSQYSEGVFMFDELFAYLNSLQLIQNWKTLPGSFLMSSTIPIVLSVYGLYCHLRKMGCPSLVHMK